MSDLLDTICDLIADEFAIARESITGPSRLAEDLGLDSLDIVAMSGRVEEELDVVIEDDDLVQLGSVEQVAQLVRRCLGTGTGTGTGTG